jgi:hypothetical protein
MLDQHTARTYAAILPGARPEQQISDPCAGESKRCNGLRLLAL